MRLATSSTSQKWMHCNLIILLRNSLYSTVIWSKKKLPGNVQDEEQQLTHSSWFQHTQNSSKGDCRLARQNMESGSAPIVQNLFAAIVLALLD